ncbi:MAG: FAD-dependent oxidoreductase, partial [Synechococcus sp.]|nr:FAD-dependent oxidoreductase [Synechococcus sp.]
FGLERTLTYGRLPGGLVMLNWPLNGNDWHQGLDRAFCGDTKQEAELFAAMQEHSLQFAALLEERSGGWVQLAEAFPKSAASPAPWLAAMPYWREGRRMVGRRTVIEQDLLALGEGPSVGPLPMNPAGELESIAVGNYANDHHYPGPDWPLAAKSCRWGGRWTGTPFCIPFGALVSDNVENLLAADKAISTSHMANGATRLQPLVLNVGQAAGMAAALAVRAQCPPSALPVRALQEGLIQARRAPSAVVPLWDTPWHHPAWRERQMTALDAPERCLVQESPPPIGWNDQSSDRIETFEPHARHWSGEIQPDGNGGFALALTTGRLWPLITLEPSVHHWMRQVSRPQSAQLVATANPWGPWLRVSAVL